MPLLPGVHTNGETIEEIKLNLKETILCHVQGLLKDGEEIPDEGEALELDSDPIKKRSVTAQSYFYFIPIWKWLLKNE